MPKENLVKNNNFTNQVKLLKASIEELNTTRMNLVISESVETLDENVLTKLRKANRLLRKAIFALKA